MPITVFHTRFDPRSLRSLLTFTIAGFVSSIAFAQQSAVQTEFAEPIFPKTGICFVYDRTWNLGRGNESGESTSCVQKADIDEIVMNSGVVRDGQNLSETKRRAGSWFAIDPSIKKPCFPVVVPCGEKAYPLKPVPFDYDSKIGYDLPGTGKFEYVKMRVEPAVIDCVVMNAKEKCLRSVRTFSDRGDNGSTRTVIDIIEIALTGPARGGVTMLDWKSTPGGFSITSLKAIR